ncbi:MAG: PHP domain-containing protein [Chloroflexi bacterium]|nr:PHP domain-containing protein [Chloroflexota bacterium]
MGHADLHIHATAGADTLGRFLDYVERGAYLPVHLTADDESLLRLLDYVERETNLDVIAITGHNDIASSHRARELARERRYRFEVVAGLEVTTQEGNLLALFQERLLPAGLPMARTIELVHDQGGLAIASHPMSWLGGSIGQGNLDRLMAEGKDATPDGLEVINARISNRGYTERARHLNEKRYKLAEVGGSGAHSLSDIGMGYTLFYGQTATDLKKAILEKTTMAGRMRQRRSDATLGPFGTLARAISHLWKGRRQ